VGTLLRSALALNWEGAFIFDTTADPFNSKALRAARGATFRLPLSYGGQEECDRLIKNNRLTVCVADTEGEKLMETVAAPPLLLILSNEAHGPRLSLKQNFTRVTIPMHQEMESINVASAGAILMHALKS
jgi:RNA methyltransferase, TrmH family